MQEHLLYMGGALNKDLGEPLACGLGVCWYGEVPASEFITGNALATAVGLTAGTSFNSNEPWLHFTLEDTELLVAKKPFRYGISWNDLNAKNLIYGNLTIAIDDYQYKVRLLKGSSTDPAIASTTGFGGTSHIFDNHKDHSSEWNRLMYPIHSGTHTNTGNPAEHSDPYSLPFGTFANYSDEDLIVGGIGGYNEKGIRTWTQEDWNSKNSSEKYGRGFYGVTLRTQDAGNLILPYQGWRPVLELIK